MSAFLESEHQMSAQNYQKLVQKQRDYFNTGATLSVQFRLAALKKLKAAVIAYQAKGEAALQKDLAKSQFETYLGEWGVVLTEINTHIKQLKKWTRQKRVKTPLFLRPSYSRIIYEPYGVSLILAPWNYPFQLAILPLIGAISAGNTAIIKPSELAPHTAKLLVDLIDEIFDEVYVAVVEGGVAETTDLLKQRFDFIFFTGSTNVGRIIARAAAEHLTPVVLELGGKSPVILDKDIPIKVAVKRLAMAKISNCGQVCVAPDYIVLPREGKAEFIEVFKTVVREFFPTGNLDEASTYQTMTRIINQRNFKRLQSLLEGEKILWGGKAFEAELKCQPTLIDSGDVADYLNNKRQKTAILQEEIFGPFLPVLTYDNINDVIQYVNAGEKPLALYLYSNNKVNINKVLNSVSFGGGCINDSMVHIANDYLPFGGVGQSGQGAYHGKTSFLTFSHAKSLLYSTTLFDLPVKYMPYTDSKLKLLKKLFK